MIFKQDKNIYISGQPRSAEQRRSDAADDKAFNLF
jgi:hypothetical protein